MILNQGYKIIGKRLYKFALNEKKHLLWSKGGVPCVDAFYWDVFEMKLEEIVIHTKQGRTFRISRDDFNAHKQLIEHKPYGQQYVVPVEYWTINATDETKKANEEGKLALRYGA